jgi:hypothetical protein
MSENRTSEPSNVLNAQSHTIELHHSFANGYGTSFICSSVCHFITITFSFVIVLFLVLLCVIPVSTTKYVKQQYLHDANQKQSPRGKTLGHKTTKDGQMSKLKLPRSHYAYLHVHPHVLAAYTDTDEEKSCHSTSRDEDPEDFTSIDDTAYEFVTSLSEAEDHYHHQRPLLINSIRRPSHAGSSPPRGRATSAATKVVPDICYHGPQTRISMPTSPSSMEANAVKAVQDNVKRANIAKKNEHRKTLRVVDTSFENLPDEAIKEHEYLEFIQTMMDGLVLKKMKRKKNGSQIASKRLFKITHDWTRLQWAKQDIVRKAFSKEESVALIDIKGIATHGTNSENSNETTHVSNSSTIMYLRLLKTDGSSLDVQAEDQATHQKLFNGFTRMLNEDIRRSCVTE